MGKGMKLLRDLLLGLLIVTCAVAAVVTVMSIFGNPRETTTLERSPPDRGREEMLTTGNVFESDTDRFVWLASMPPAGEVETWQFFPSIPVEAEPGDIVTLSVPAFGFLSWESDSGLADIEFFDERIEADRAITSFVLPDGLFLVWASYEYISHEHEGVMLMNPDRFEDGAVQLDTDNPANWPTATNPLRLAYGMFNNPYIDVINFVGLESDATVTVDGSFYTSLPGGGSDRTDHPSSGGTGAALHGLIYSLSSETGANRSFTMLTPLTPNPEFNSTNPDGLAMQRSFIGPRFFPQGMIDGNPALGLMPTVVVTFNFSIDITWPDIYIDVSHPVLDEYDEPVFVGGVQQFHPPVPVLDRPGGSINVPIIFTVLPQPNINRALNRPLPFGMDGVYYGRRQIATDPVEWTTEGHDTRINVEIVESDHANFPNPVGTPGDPPGIGEIFWAFTIRTYAGDGRGGGVDLRFPTPDPVANNANPELDLVLSRSPTTTEQISTVELGGVPITGPITFGVGENQRFVIRLSAFMRHPSADIMEQEIGFTEQYFELTILPRPRFAINDGTNDVFGLTALSHMMVDQQASDNEPDESTSITRDLIAVVGLPSVPGSTPLAFTNWDFSWDFSEPWSTPPRPGPGGGGTPGRQFLDPDPITGSSRFRNQLPPGLSFRTRSDDWNGFVDNIVGGRAEFDLIGVPPPDTYGRFIIGFEVDSFRETGNRNIQTSERIEFELIIWPRTYLRASGRGMAASPLVRRVTSGGAPEQTVDFIQSDPLITQQYANERAVMPGTMGVVSFASTEFIRWEHDRRFPPPANTPDIGGRAGTNLGAPGHTAFTGHDNTASHALMTMEMPKPWDSHNGFYDPYAPPAHVYIEGVLSTNPPRIVFAGEPGRVDLSDDRSLRVENGGDPGDTRLFRWELLPQLQPGGNLDGLVGLNPTLLPSGNFLSVLLINPTQATPPNYPYEFTVSVFLQGSMRMDFPLSLAILGRPGAGDINLDGRIDYWDLLLLVRHFEGGPYVLTGQSYENARDIIPNSSSVALRHLTEFRRIFGIREVNVPS